MHAGRDGTRMGWEADAHTPTPHDHLPGRAGAPGQPGQGGRQGTACPAVTPPRTGAVGQHSRAADAGERDGVAGRPGA
eukprot:691863-Pleurochrysis_carterae.AAC.1